MLDRSFLYQNKSTGSASTTTLSARQLCRILCPAVDGIVANIQSDTMVLGYDGQTYEKEWKAAKTVPVLRESCAEWYYSLPPDKEVEGPVSCRALSKLLQDGKITPQTKVYSSALSKQGEDQTWSSIHNLPYLQAALEAFETTPPPWKIPGNGNSAETTNGAAAINPLQNYDSSVMTFDTTNETGGESREKEVQDELEAFLSSTADVGPSSKMEDDEEDEVYESDGGTVYGKCPSTGNWIHSDLLPPKKPSNAAKATSSAPNNNSNKRKRKKPKFSAKNSKCWIYVTGLPTDTNQDEVTRFFQKAGIIDLDPETQAPKTKLYYSSENKLKGDASICYARPESVELALQLLDEAPFRLEDPTSVVKVQRAKFEQHGDSYKKKSAVSNAKRKVAKLAALQAVDWDESENGRISGGRKGLCIIVLKHMFDPNNSNDKVFAELEKQVHTTCEQYGSVEKITIFSKHPDGVVIVKFGQPKAANTAIQEYDGLVKDGRQVKASFWDGVTDYTVRDEEKEHQETEQRLDEFGSWLESQEVPEEFKLQVEGHT